MVECGTLYARSGYRILDGIPCWYSHALTGPLISASPLFQCRLIGWMFGPSGCCQTPCLCLSQDFRIPAESIMCVTWTDDVPLFLMKKVLSLLDTILMASVFNSEIIWNWSFLLELSSFCIQSPFSYSPLFSHIELATRSTISHLSELSLSWLSTSLSWSSLNGRLSNVQKYFLMLIDTSSVMLLDLLDVSGLLTSYTPWLSSLEPQPS